ncbi:MAG: CRTAC1 family protein [Candidatus Poribacteria bacterium]|nr:CRTAC1 family protein [Candidatus Poribacteria bacterium]MDE0506861.1 CRTAC1 family protein [Candidatus Poribacteria bacterium]
MIARKLHFGLTRIVYLCSAIALTLLVFSVAGAEPKQVPVPEEAHNPPWLESRKQAQLETVDQFKVFHDFQFTDRVMDSGIQFVHQIVDDAGKDYKLVHYDHGNGIVIADVDMDDRYDIYFISQLSGNELWRNLGDGRFENITKSAGVAVEDRISVTASFADTDNDGDADLFVTTVGMGNLLFENDGTGVFKDVTETAGLGYVGHSSSGIFFDYNLDGLLDLFLTNVGVYTIPLKGRGGYWVGLRDAFTGHLWPDRTENSILYKNMGNNRFADVTEETGLIDGSWSGDASPIDVNGDNYPDLYVLNMQGHDEYYENVKGESFVKKSREVFPKTPWGAMGIKVFDYNNDGMMDIIISDMHSDMSEDIGPEREKLKSRMQWPESSLRSGGNSIFGNAFFKNEGGGNYVEVSDEIGTENYWPWGLSVGDFNADGYDDVFLTSSMNYPFRYGVNSLLLNNRGEVFLDSEFIVGVEPRRDGRTAKPWFELDCSGEDSGHKDCKGQTGRITVLGALGTRSSIIFDLDDDGDLDIVTNEFNSEPLVLISNLSDKRAINFLKVKLIGTKSNRDGLGATVTVTAGSNTYVKVHDGQSGYLSQSLYPLYFGLDDADIVNRIDVLWPSGKKQVVAGPLDTNKLIDIEEE